MSTENWFADDAMLELLLPAFLKFNKQFTLLFFIESPIAFILCNKKQKVSFQVSTSLKV